MIKAILVDDEESALDALEDELNEIDSIRIVGKFTNPLQALHALQTMDVDIAFIDIEMPGMNSLEMTNHVMQVNAHVEVVFVTAYDQYAVEAFEVNALDYILKPVMQERLLKTVAKWSARNKKRTKTKPLPPVCRIICLGSFQLRFAKNPEELVKWRTNKVKELMAYFVHHHGKEVHKAALIEDIWPLYDEERAMAHLHTAVYYIRKLILHYGLQKYMNIDYANHFYRFTMKGVMTDLELFLQASEELAAVGEHRLGPGLRAVELYKGSYMGDLGYAWAIPAQHRLEKAYVKLVRKLADYYIREQLYEEGELLLRNALVHHSLEEDLHERLLEILACTGKRSEVDAHYRELKTRMFEELGLLPRASVYKLVQEQVRSAPERSYFGKKGG